MRRGLTVSLLSVVGVALLAMAGTLVAGNSPKLGLDLQGGASVVLHPDRPVSGGVLEQAINIIRQRVDALGVAEADIKGQGSDIVIQLPGVKDTARALTLVGQTAELRFRPVLGTLPPEKPKDSTTTTSTTSTTATTLPGASTTVPPTTTTTRPEVPSTPREENKKDAQVVLPTDEKGQTARYALGPAEMTGEGIKTASAALDPNGQWLVNFTLNGQGSKDFDALAGKNFKKQVAIELDGVVKSAPTINAQTFGGRGQISGSFTQRNAKDLALVLRYGSLPVQLKQQSVQTVSATLGKDSLRAGIVAGLIGLILVLLYMILYYRALGVVVFLGLGISSMLLYSIISYLSKTNGLALSLAGATGIIVSVGVTVDSYVVYFERLKDEIRSGKTIRSSVDRGFARAYRTIVAADLVSLIAAATLYFLTVGSVRGFAFFLGLSTLLDMATAYLFTRPMVILLGRNRLFTEARFFGVARGLAANAAGGGV